MLEFWPFASVTMLGWAAAAAVPIVLHLWNRRQRQEIDWAAMRFLVAAQKARSRRVTIEQWVLLLLRVLIVVCFVLAIAEPFLPGMWSMAVPPIGRTHHVLIVDGSHSMSRPIVEEADSLVWQAGPGRATPQSRASTSGAWSRALGGAEPSAWEAAIGRAVELVESADPGDGFSILVAGRTPRTIVGDPSFDQAATVAELKRLTRGQDVANLTATVAAASGLIQVAERDHPHMLRATVTILTDGQAVAWPGDSGLAGDPSQSGNGPTPDGATEARATVARVGDSRANGSRATWDRQTPWARRTWTDLASRAEVRVQTFPVRSANVAIQALTVAEPLVRRGVPVPVRVDLAAWTEELTRTEGPTPTTVELLVDGRLVTTEPVTWGDATTSDQPRTRSILVEAVFPREGLAEVEARIPADTMPGDDRRFLTVPVRSSVAVTIVSDRDEDAFEMAVALDPLGDGTGPITAGTMATDRLDGGALRGTDVLILSNVGNLSGTVADQVATYLAGGGTVWVFPGDRSRAEDLTAFQRRIGPSGPDVVTWGRPESGLFRLAVPTEPEPAVAAVAGQTGSGVFLVPSFRIVPLAVVEETPERQESGSETSAELAWPTVLLRWTDGRPAVVTGRAGPGRWVAWGLAGSTASLDRTTDPVRQWTTLPTAGDFVSLLQEVALTLSVEPPGARDVQVGDVLRGTMSPLPSSPGVTMERPGGRADRVLERRQGEVTTWTYRTTDQPGFYRLRVGTERSADASAASSTVRIDSLSGGRTARGGGRMGLAGLAGPAGPYAVNVDPSESDPRPAPVESLSRLLSGLPTVQSRADLADNDADTPRERGSGLGGNGGGDSGDGDGGDREGGDGAESASAPRRPSGYPLYFAWLLAAMGFLVAEGYWAWRVRRTGGAP